MVVTATRLESGGRGEDRLAIERGRDRVLVIVADGEGGTAGGARAAEAICGAAAAAFRAGLFDGRTWADRLRAIDSMMVTAAHGGASTVVIAEIIDSMVSGASVGDSSAWLVSPSGIVDLTERQVRKPLLGTGLAEPVGFGPVPMTGRLIVGTDGLFKYIPRSRLMAIALAGVIDVAAGALVEAVRLKSGRFQDDVGVVLCEESG
jgi:hypothetical protein